jgi:hypothetical protein
MFRISANKEYKFIHKIRLFFSNLYDTFLELTISEKSISTKGIESIRTSKYGKYGV